MHKKRDFKCKDAALVDTIMTNDAIVDGFSGRITKHHRRFRHNKLLEDACTIERCKNMVDFLLITRNEFTGIDARQKESIFGKSFDNIDCPSVVNVCFRCCTLGQTFNDNFSLTRQRKTLSTIVSKVIPPCTLSKVHLMMMCFIYKFIQSHYFVKLNVAEDAVHRYIGESIFFHDRLIDLFVNEAGDPTKFGTMDRNDIYVIFDMCRTKKANCMCTFVYVGEYLTREFCNELDDMQMNNFFPKTYAMVKMVDDDDNIESYDVGDNCHRREVVVSRLRIKLMADELNDYGTTKFAYFNTVGGLYINKSIDKRLTIGGGDATSLKEMFDVYGFVVALFCQVFESKQVFSTNAWKEMYEMKRGNNRIRYYAKDWVANDGSVKTTLRYKCDRGGDATMDTAAIMENVYNTVIKDFDADLLYNSRGYVPSGSPKKLMKEYVVYDKSVGDRELYEDRGRKHLYEWHHDCKKKQYCDFCREGLRKTSYKRGDFYQVENEEMSCTSVRVSYELLDKFFDKRSRLDKNSKDMMFNTLIPPPVSEDADARVRWVYVTELEKDLSCSFISPSTVQDPCWVDYDESIVRLKLTEKARRRSSSGGDNDDVPRLVDKLNTQCSALRCLNDYMVNFGTGLQPDFSTIKFYLRHWYGGDKEFIANFLSTTTLGLLRECMFQLARLRRKVGKNRADKEEPIRPIFSPSCVHLLSALNVVRRSSRIAMDLCDVDLMTERIGSFLGSVLEERDQLLGRCYAKCVLMREKKEVEGRGGRRGYVFNPQSIAYKMCEAGVENESSHSASVNSFQSKLYAFQVLMDAYKYLSVGLHHWSNLVCPTCHPTHLMKQELQTMMKASGRRYP